MPEPRALFAALFDAAVATADPVKIMPRFLPARPPGRVVVVGAGKASARMAAALETCWGETIEGVVVTPYGYGHGVMCKKVRIVEAGHPVPDEAGLAATRQLFAAVEDLSSDDLVVALISGGGSALLPSPPPGMTLEDEIAVNQALLASGAPIAAMNIVRSHLSTIKGGRLALAAYPAKVVSLIVSDIPGDVPTLIASGPTVASSADRHDALAAVEAYRIQLPAAAMRHLQDEAACAPAPDDPRLAGNEAHIIASAAHSLEAAAHEAEMQGVKAVILSDAMEGEARDAGSIHAAIAREIVARDRPFTKPVMLLSGGETTVTLHDAGGSGGRNTEFLLALALAIDGIEGISAFAADTDGIDGKGGHAGAFADWHTASRIRQAGIDPRAALARHASGDAFAAIGSLFSPGPTGTNVNDLRAILIR